LTSQDRKKIIEMKKMNPFHEGRLSSALYMMNTQPSCDAATYTVKKLVAATVSSSSSSSSLSLYYCVPKIKLKLFTKFHLPWQKCYKSVES